MSKKPNALQAALSQSGGRKPAAGPMPQVARQVGQEPNYTQRPPSRKGKVNVSGWLDPAYKRSLRMVQAVSDKKLELLLAEALNDLFAKYNVPQIHDD